MVNPIIVVVAIVAIVLLLLWIFRSMGSMKKTQFSTNLTFDQEVPTPPVESTATGSGSGTLVDSNTFAYDIMVQGSALTGPITGSHFHHAPIGQPGPIVKDITFGPPDPSGVQRATGTWTSTDQQPLTKELVDSLLKGNIYVNVHTDANPAGEIRGQLMPLVM